MKNLFYKTAPKTKEAEAMKNLTPIPYSQKNNSLARWNWYPVITLLLIFVFPVLSILAEFKMTKTAVDPGLIGKWFIFWAVGLRLFTAGIKQTFNPEFTAFRIFHLKSSESFVVIRELGFANIAIGVMGIVSVMNGAWREISGITGSIFFGLAAIQHFIRKPVTRNEMAAMVTDLLVFAILLLYLFFSLSFAINKVY